MIPKYDVIIKSARKDYNKLEYVVNSIIYLNPQPENIYIVSPDDFIPSRIGQYSRIVKSINDDEVFPTSRREEIIYRKNWVFTQFIALFQDFTSNDYYLDIQADNIFLDKVDLFNNNGTPRLFISEVHDHYHEPYFNFSKRYFGVDKIHTKSFIIDFMLYNKKLTKEMLVKYSTFELFFNTVKTGINEKCYPADQELYPNWLIKNKYKYEIVENVNVRLFGLYYPTIYSSKLINKIVLDSKGYQALSIHTWGDETHHSYRLVASFRNKIRIIELKYPNLINYLRRLYRKLLSLLGIR